jgi:hypothetical protein
LWAKAIRSEIYTWPAYQLGLDNVGNCYIGGDYTDSLEFETGQILAGSSYNHFLAKYSSDGNLAWTENLLGSSGPSSLFGIAVFAENSVLVSGRIYNEPMIFGTTTISSANSNAYLALVGNSLPLGIMPTGREEEGLKVFPNPATKTIFLNFRDQPGKLVVCSLTDVNGKNVFSDTFAGSQSVKIDLPELPAGVYFLSVTTKKESYNEKVVIY